jgi:hypothetical protein
MWQFMRGWEARLNHYLVHRKRAVEQRVIDRRATKQLCRAELAPLPLSRIGTQRQPGKLGSTKRKHRVGQNRPHMEEPRPGPGVSMVYNMAMAMIRT